jgi:hypothetical protein
MKSFRQFYSRQWSLSWPRVILAIRLVWEVLFMSSTLYFMDMFGRFSMDGLWKRVNLLDSYVSGVHNFEACGWIIVGLMCIV